MLKLKPGTETFRWTISRGMAWSQVIQILDDAGAPRDLTGASVRMLLGPSWQEDPVLEATIGAGITVLDAAQGVLKILLTPIQTLALMAGVAVLDLAVMAADGIKLLHLRSAGKVQETLEAQLGEGAVPPTPDAFAGLIEGRPLLIDPVSETEDFLVSDPARGPDRLGRRRARPILDAKADLALVEALKGSPPALLATLQQLAAAIANSPTFGANVLLRLGSLEAGQGAMAISRLTKAILDAVLDKPDGTPGLVTNDPVLANNRLYTFNAGTSMWVLAVDRVADLLPGYGLEVLPRETGYVAAWVDPVTRRSPMRITLAGRIEVDDIALPDGAVALANLATALQPLIPTSLNVETGYVWALVDPVSGRAPVRVTVQGRLEVDDLPLAAGAVAYSNLSSELQGLLPATLSPYTGYVWALVDPVSGRAPVRVSTTGDFEADSLRLGASTVGLAALTTEAKRFVGPNAFDVVPVRPDVWRGRRGGTAAYTEPDGSFWCEFGAMRTRWIGGVNKSGTTIEIRRSAGLPILGRRYGGSGFDASVSQSIASKGSMAGPTIGTPVGTFAAGDYYLYVNDSTPGDYLGSPLINGDVLVYTGSAWVVRAAPGTFGQRTRGQWWDVTAAGWWQGVQYGVGDRIVYVGVQAAGGSGTQVERWMRAPAGDGRLYYRGQFAPGSGLPSTYLEGDVFQASAPGDAGGFTFATGDYLVRDDGSWGLVANAPAQVIAVGGFVSLPCGTDASEHEVRRFDQSGTAAGVCLRALTQSSRRRHDPETLALFSDSMFGGGGSGAKIIAATGRSGTVRSFGGARSLQVLTMIEWWLTQGDPHAGQILLPWHGQNNQPSTEANSAQVRYSSLRMAELVGARDARMLFLSILGQRAHAWNGSRITATQHENQWNKTSHLYELNQWYEATFPGRWISPYWVLLAAATDQPDPTFPGMTEKQVAATYGIAPWSFFATLTPGATWTPAQLSYQGTWNTAGLPTGGSNLQYYLRIGGGGVGNLLVNEGGTWVERSMDVTHLSEAGGAALATGGSGQSGAGIPASSGVAGFLVDRLL